MDMGKFTIRRDTVCEGAITCCISAHTHHYHEAAYIKRRHYDYVTAGPIIGFTRPGNGRMVPEPHRPPTVRYLTVC